MGALDGRVALVTGASRGLGEYMAKELARQGARVAVAARTEQVMDPRLPGTIHTVTQAIKDEGGQALAVRMDVRYAESITSGVQAVVAEWGKVDILINNAAILIPGTIESVQPRHLDLIWEIDLRGPLLLMRECVPLMRAAGQGHIINISSTVAKFPGPGPYKESASGGSFYFMVKAGLERYTQALAMELQDANIAVNVLSPLGMIHTPGNIFAENDREHPNLNFEPAFEMGKSAAWICAQPPRQFTGNIVYDQEVVREHRL